MEIVVGFGKTLVTVLRDVLPVAAMLSGFQVLALRGLTKGSVSAATGNCE